MRSCILFLCSILPLGASTVVNGGQLLTQTYADQLATWLGQGDLSLTNIFSSAPVANGSGLFHAAADAQGPTFSVIQTNLGLVGGYNPQSWSSISNYNITTTNNLRTAFIFNLSINTLLPQILLNMANFDAGQYQTYNYSQYGPAFGGGHDLVINNNTLGSGYAYSFSYGNGQNGANIFGISSSSITTFTVSRVEAYTFTVSPTNGVPEPATLLPASAGLLFLASRRICQRRNAKRA